MTPKREGPVVLVGEALACLAHGLERPLDRGSTLDLTFAGAEVNVAIGLSRMGHAARWLSVVGEDIFGNMVLRGLRGEGVDVGSVQVSGSGPTALMVKSPRPGGEPEVFYYRGQSAMSRAGVGTFGEASWRDARVLYLTGITPALSATCRELVLDLVDTAYDAGIPIWFDPNHRRKLWTDEQARKTIGQILPKTTVVLAGLSEGEMLTGESSPDLIAGRLLELGAKSVVVKSGDLGSGLWEADGSVLRVEAFPIERVVDAVGAGDAFAAGLLSARLEGADWEASLIRGNAFGAIVCQTRGDWEGLPDPRALSDFLAQKREAVR